ncbi:Riboflavin kinase, partial [Bienertia sinuspersici]
RHSSCYLCSIFGIYKSISSQLHQILIWLLFCACCLLLLLAAVFCWLRCSCFVLIATSCFSLLFPMSASPFPPIPLLCYCPTPHYCPSLAAALPQKKENELVVHWNVSFVKRTR